MKNKLLMADGQIVLINDILNAHENQHQLTSYELTGCYQIALRLGIEFNHLKSQNDLESQNTRIYIERIEYIIRQLFIYFNKEHGYFVQHIKSESLGNLYLTSFLLDLLFQIKDNKLTKAICPFNYDQMKRSLKWIISNQKETSKSLELASKLTTISQTLITLCSVSFKFDTLDSLDSRIDKNLFNLINESIKNQTKLLASLDLAKLGNDFSPLLVLSLFKCKNDLFKKFYFDLIRFYTKRLDSQNYYISLSRMHAHEPYLKNGNLRNLDKAFNERTSLRPRSFDQFDTQTLLNTAIFIILKLELNDYDDLNKFYNFLNNHKLEFDEWTSDLTTFYSSSALLELRRHYYRNINNLRKMLSRPNKQIYYKQIVGNNLTEFDLKDKENLNKVTKVNLELLNDLNNFKEINFKKEFYFEFKRFRMRNVSLSNRELMQFSELLLNLNGVGHFKIDLNINCYFKNLIIESIPHVKAFNHFAELKLIKNNAYNLTLCQRFTLDRNYSPLTIILFYLPIQLNVKEDQSDHLNYKINYISDDHHLYIQLFNVSFIFLKGFLGL